MKKRVLSIFMALSMTALLLAGCGGAANNQTPAGNGNEAGSDAQATAGDDANKPADDNQAAGGKKVGITMVSVDGYFLSTISGMMKDALVEKGCEVQVDSANGDAQKQNEQIENFVTMGCDIIVVWPVNADGVGTACKAAMDKGVQVLAMPYEVAGVTASVISPTDTEMGEKNLQMANAWIDKTFPDAKDGEVKTLVIGGSTSPEMVERTAALKKIAENKKVKMVYVDSPNMNDREEGRKCTENAFLTDSDITCVIAVNAETALGVEAFVSAQNSPVKDPSKFAIFTVDQTDEVMSKIADSATDKSTLRGTVSMGSMDDTITDFMKGMTPLLTGTEPVPVKGSAVPIDASTLGN